MAQNPDLSKRRTSRNNRREKRNFRCRNSAKAYLSAGLFFFFFFSGAQACTKFFLMQLFSLSLTIQDLELLSCCLILGDIFSGLSERDVYPVLN